MPTNSYTIPTWGTPTPNLHGWLTEAVQEGRAWLAAQKQATAWEAAVALMDEADIRATGDSPMSNTQYPKAKRIATELVATLAGFRHEGEFSVLWDNSLYNQAHILTDLDRNWYQSTQAYLEHRKGLQNAVIKGTGYWLEEWNKNYWGPNKGDVELLSVDPADVTFVQLPADNDLQKAYMVIVRYEMPINLAKRLYMPINPGFAQALVPDQESPSWIMKGLQKVQQFVSPALRVAGRTRQTANGSFPTVDIYKAWTLDSSINMGTESIAMGPAGTNWSYTVPAIGDPLPTGLTNPATGAEWTRPAKEEDCLLFPLRRFTIFSNTGIAYDGTASNWHGMAPLARIWFNDLPWNALGGSLISDIRTMNQGVTAMMQLMEDAAAARLDPAMVYDDNLVSDSWAKSVNPRLAGVRAKAPISQGDVMKPILPPQYYDVPPWIPVFMDAQENRMNYLTAVQDMVALAKAKQIPGADTLEKLLEMVGPVVQDRVQALVAPLSFLGELRKAYYFQFYNEARIIRTVGPDDFDPEQWQFYPERLEQFLKTPRGQQMEQRYGKQGAMSIATQGAFSFSPALLNPQLGSQNPAQRTAFGKRSINEFRYDVSESVMNEMYAMTTKLLYLQLQQRGMPISWWTMAKLFKIPNFGPPPEGTNTELERWIAQQRITIDLQADLQREMAQDMGGMIPGAEGATPPEAGGANGNGNGQRGRPPSFNRPPRMVQKDGGSRTTITTS